MADGDQNEITQLTVELLSAYLGNHQVAKDDLATLIHSTRDALVGASAETEIATPDAVPAVSIRKSLSSPDHIISLIDGKPYKTLKRHLTSQGLTAEEYRARYKLPASYPIVAPAYSEMRRATASRIGLGRKISASAGEISTSKTKASPKITSVKAKPPRQSGTDEQPTKAKLPAAEASQPQTGNTDLKSKQAVARTPKSSNPAAKPAATKTKAQTVKSETLGFGVPSSASGDKPAKPKLRIKTPKVEADIARTDTQLAAQIPASPVTPAASAKAVKAKSLASSPSYRRWPKADTKSAAPKSSYTQPTGVPADKRPEGK